MIWKTILTVALLNVCAVAHTGSQVRLIGLDRLYFSHVAGPGEQLRAPHNTAFLLPVTLPKPQFVTTDSQPIKTDGVRMLFVHDFQLPLNTTNHPVWIRELTNVSHPRITELWWALYDGGYRTDVWYYTATPDRTDNKLLSNYRLDTLSIPVKDIVVFRVQGEMFRPGGAWWIVGKEFVFSVNDSIIIFLQVKNAFGFFHSYDIDSHGGVLSVSTEREVGGRFETREVEPVSERTANACGFRATDLTEAEEWRFSWWKLVKIAECITSQYRAVVTSRNIETPSFVERAGSPPQKSP